MAPIVLNPGAWISETAQKRCDLRFHDYNIEGSISANLSSIA